MASPCTGDTSSPPLGCEWRRNLVSNFCPGRGLNPRPRSLMATNITTQLRCTPPVIVTVNSHCTLLFMGWEDKCLAFGHWDLRWRLMCLSALITIPFKSGGTVESIIYPPVFNCYPSISFMPFISLLCPTSAVLMCPFIEILGPVIFSDKVHLRF